MNASTFKPVSVFRYFLKREDGSVYPIDHYVSRSRTGVYHISHEEGR